MNFDNAQSALQQESEHCQNLLTGYSGSMEILRDYDLTGLNTFGVEARARYVVELENEGDVPRLFALPEFKNNKKLFLGGGSNILLTRDFDGVVILNKLKGIEIVRDEGDIIHLRAMGGEIWHDVVTFAVERGYWGIENLALIPGTVGAAPMQNIGAYGAELKEVLESVEAYNVETGEKKIFSMPECKPGYRDSVFKRELKDTYFISAVTMRLSKTEKKNLNYKSLREYVEKNNITVQSPKDVSDAVSHIRRTKLPNPVVIGNAGSFFKNVFVNGEELARLRKEFPDIPSFQEETKGEIKIKIPAAWLIEHAGSLPDTRSAAIGGGPIPGSWKGWRVGHVGVHQNHALILVNYGAGTGEDIKNLANDIINSVYKKFGIRLEPEVNFV